MTESLDVLRAELQARGVDDTDMSNEPFDQFHRWFRVCVDAGVHEPEAMVVSSVDDGGRPSSRHVLLRGLDRGFVFFTNITSQKGARAHGATGCGHLLPLERPGPPGTRRRRRREGDRWRGRRLLRVPPAREPDRGLGLTSE